VTSISQRKVSSWNILHVNTEVVKVFILVEFSYGLFKKMPGSRCVVQDCSNTSKHSTGISLHSSPVNKPFRDQWVRFVRTHRANFNAKGRFMICSNHFESSCFQRTMHLEGFRRFLLPGSAPTIWKTKELLESSTARSRRKVRVIVVFAIIASQSLKYSYSILYSCKVTFPIFI